MELILASGNRHKADELNDIFRGHTIRIPRELGVSYGHTETADTFRENSFGKAQSLYEALLSAMGAAAASRFAIIADDSGLCVSSLDGRPGLHSARYGDRDGSKGLSDMDRNRLLLEELEGVTERSAYFACAMTLLFDRSRFAVVQEAWHGEIAYRASTGTGGFGYDPLFYVPALGCTAADLPPERKNRLSHRARAAAQVRLLLQTESDSTADEQEGLFDRPGGM